MKVCLVHDDLVQEGGAERLFAEIAKIYPDAPIYTSLFDWSRIPKSIDPKRIKTSFIQKIPLANHLYKILLPLYPFAFESFDFSDFDLIISSTTRFAKSIITKPNTVHISYVNSVPRFLFNQNQADQYLPRLLRFILKPYFNWLKRWDKVASSRPDFYIANSQNVALLIMKVYELESTVIYPFADTDFFRKKRERLRELKSDSYYLVVSRLVKWKKIDIAIQAACELGVDLKIVGTGPDEERLKEILHSVQNDNQGSVEFLGSVSKEELRGLYQNAKTLIVTQEEDFGIAAAEAQSCGTAVIAYAKGGATEIIINNKTGLTFENQTANSLKDAIKRAAIVKYDHTVCRKNALRFTKVNFTKELTNFVNNARNSR